MILSEITGNLFQREDACEWDSGAGYNSEKRKFSQRTVKKCIRRDSISRVRLLRR
jgi:hypothetical protein